ncbi:MAG TPA: VOC family protein [Stellaceae bacterium]|nr:VOC family protein [Stellaceae bacterium]
MSIQALGYAGIVTDRPDDWAAFASRLLGMQVTERGVSGMSLRMDDRKQRLLVETGAINGCQVYGWEVADATALSALGGRLEQAGVAVTHGPATLAQQRQVAALIWCADPIGNRLEFFHGAALADGDFVPGRAISGFRTGALGLGHVVLTAKHAEPVIRFYRDILGFRLSDYTLRPFKAWFFHVNRRHHSFAVVETGQDGLHHLMVELLSLDDVGQGYDLAQGLEDAVGVTLGRHTNDLMTSFYAKSPSGFMVEYGWGGRNIDPAAWQPVEYRDGPSLWGHDRSWLSPADRALARQLRLDAAAKGTRAPVHVLPGNHLVMAKE